MTITTETLIIHIIDDDESVRKGMARLMRSAGIESHTYDRAKSFLSETHSERNACIIMDINMPHISGLELYAHLMKQGIEMPVIVVSARDDDETRQLAQDMGVHFFLRKPVDDQALMDAITWVIQSHPKQSNL